MFPNKFPYSNMHDLNLDWIIKKLKEVSAMYTDLYGTISGIASDYLQEHLPLILGDSLNTFIGNVNASLANMDTSIADIQNEIDTLNILVSALESGTPQIVSATADMTDTDKIYLYTGSENGYVYGDWYYYDTGTETWADGGTYGEGGINATARGILGYILRKLEYTDANMENKVTALIDALASGTGELPGAHTISYVLTHATSSNQDPFIDDGEPYTTSITPDIGYVFDNFTVIMDGYDITDTVRNTFSLTNISIPSVTGDVIITVHAKTIPTSYTLNDLHVEWWGVFTYTGNGAGTYIYKNPGFSTKLMSVTANEGLICLRETTDYNDITTMENTNIFPIPIPPTATSITFSWTATTQKAQFHAYKLNSGLPYFYDRVLAGSLTAGGSNTISFTAGEYEYFTINFSNTNYSYYPTITGLTITIS